MTKALNHLKKDKILKKVIDKHGELIEIPESENIFKDIFEAIASQQLSIRASDTIINRVKILLKNKITPESFLKVDTEKLRKCGLSYSKIKYIKDLSDKVIKSEIDLENLKNLENEDVILELVKVKGIGRWTAEMILIFTLKREDVFSVGDLGLRNAVSKLYNIDKNNIEIIEGISLQWKPYRSLASRYLWKSLQTN